MRTPLRALLTILLMVLPSTALALEGRVVDKRTGVAVANAEVTILGQTGSVKTDADGRFSWKPDPKAPFVILVILADGKVARPIEDRARCGRRAHGDD